MDRPSEHAFFRFMGRKGKDSSKPNEHTVQKYGQIYNPRKTDQTMQLSRAFCKYVKRLPSKQYRWIETHKLTDINKGLALFVICQNYSRIETNIKDIIKEIPEEDTLSYSNVCIVVFHVKQKEILPSTMPTDTLVDDVYQKYKFIDVAFSKTIYDCDMNTTARYKIKSFLKLKDAGFNQVDALDPSKPMLEQAEYFIEKPLDITAGTYDVVVGVGVFGYSLVPCNAIHEMVRLTKPGGYVIMSIRESVTIYQEYKDMEPTMQTLEKDGTWKSICRTVYPNFLKDCAGNLYVFKRL